MPSKSNRPAAGNCMLRSLVGVGVGFFIGLIVASPASAASPSYLLPAATLGLGCCLALWLQARRRQFRATQAAVAEALSRLERHVNGRTSTPAHKLPNPHIVPDGTRVRVR